MIQLFIYFASVMRCMKYCLEIQKHCPSNTAVSLSLVFSRMTLLIRNWMAVGNPDSNLCALFEMHYL